MRTLLPSVLILVACNTAPTRTVSGRLSDTQRAYVFSETIDNQQTSTQPGPDGTFTIELPTGKVNTLLVAVDDGQKVRVIRHIGPTWFTLSPGPTINLGVVRPEGEPVGELTPITTPAPQQCPSRPGRADLPYDAKLALGQTWKLADAFAEKGAQPAQVLQVTMDGAGWRLAELRSGAAFTVTQADCDHEGNRSRGRDRAVITWRNADGSTETDHLDMRYCESSDSSSSSSSSSGPSSVSNDSDDCDEMEHHGCGDERSSCDDDSELTPASGPSCPGTVTEGSSPGPAAPIN